jgi:hypothetical protein
MTPGEPICHMAIFEISEFLPTGYYPCDMSELVKDWVTKLIDSESPIKWRHFDTKHAELT